MKRARPATAPKKKPALKRQRTSLLIQPSSRGRLHEKKNIDVVTSTALVPFGVATATLAPCITGCTEGASPTQHVGRGIQLKSMLYRLVVVLAPTTTGSSPVRIVIVYDKQSNATQATAATVFTVDSITSPMNLTFNHRFIVLFDDYIDCLGTSGPQSFVLRGFKKLNLPVEFNSTNGGTFADIVTGNITAYVYSASTFGVASPGTTLYTRLRFEDS